MGAPFGYDSNLRRQNPITFIDGAATSGELLGAGGGNIPVGSYFPDANGWSTDITTFAGYNGELAAGDWTLRVGDYAAEDTGRLVEWQLHIEVVPEPSSSLLMIVGLAGLMVAGNSRARRASGPCTPSSRQPAAG